MTDYPALPPPKDWIDLVAEDLRAEPLLTNEKLREIIEARRPEPPLLICVDPRCRNTESCAGAMARAFNFRRCVYCGSPFEVLHA